MANHKPLVLVAGRKRELTAADGLAVPGALGMGVVSSLPTPSADYEGMMLRLSTDGLPYYCDGLRWMPLSTGGGAPVSFKAYSTATKAATSGQFTKIDLNAVEFDTASCFDTSSGKFQPSTAGYYQINASAWYSGGTSLSQQATRITKNGSEVVGYASAGAASQASSGVLPCACVVYMNGTTDYLELYTYVLGTSPVIGANASYCWLSGHLISAASYTGATYGTAVTASGTAIDFTGIPGWANKIKIMFAGLSSSGTSGHRIRIGSGSFDTSGYLNGGMVVTAASTCDETSGTTDDFLATPGGDGARSCYGVVELTRQTGNVWMCQTTAHDQTTSDAVNSTGYKSLASALDRIRLTTVNGTDTFDAGTINISYEA